MIYLPFLIAHWLAIRRDPQVALFSEPFKAAQVDKQPNNIIDLYP
jgi:hypothetical protein